MTTGPMLYVRQSLGPDEELVYAGHFHWMYTLKAIFSIVIGFIGAVGIIYAGLYYYNNYGSGFYSQTLIGQIRELPAVVKMACIFTFLMGLFRFAQMMIVKATTEIAITTSRLVYKRGLVARYVGEMSIDRIEGVNVLQTIFGRLLGYGRVMVRGMGVGEVVLPPLANPVAFRKAIEKARTL
jgi:uncharacterized membrane protein YdbT with pleckstrin-like domain